MSMVVTLLKKKKGSKETGINQTYNNNCIRFLPRNKGNRLTTRPSSGTKLFISNEAKGKIDLLNSVCRSLAHILQ